MKKETVGTRLLGMVYWCPVWKNCLPLPDTGHQLGLVTVGGLLLNFGLMGILIDHECYRAWWFVMGLGGYA